MAFRHVGKTSPLLALIFVLGSFAPKLVLSQTLAEPAIATTDGLAQDSSQEKNLPGQKQDHQPGQLAPEPGPQIPGVNENKRIFGVLPNYRTAEMSAESIPLTSGQKLRIAVKDSFDYPLMFIAAAYAGIYQAQDDHPEFGQGAQGYFSRLGTSYTDQVDGNLLTEGFMPVLFREDPRYFRMSHGSIRKRALYAVSRVLVTRTDSGRNSFNFAEFVGNGMAAGIALSYYPDDRDVGSYVGNWMTQIGTDAASQLLKEFWPDLKRRWWNHRHKGEQAP